MAPAESMPLRDSNPESHVLAAAAAQDSTMQILKAARSQKASESNTRPTSSFIEDVEAWIRRYLNLADEVLEKPAEPDATDDKKSAA